MIRAAVLRQSNGIPMSGSRAPIRRVVAVALAATALSPVSAHAATDDDQTIVVVGDRQPKPIERAPNSTASIDRSHIAQTVNAANVEDTVKYLPGLVVRKRHIGDTQSPLATRTSGLGSSARSLIYADGALLSSLIGNNNTIASPRWGLVTPQEIERIDILYGPFSAAYPGNSIGAVVNITTQMPDHLEGSATTGVNLQRFQQYGTDRTLPAYSFGATLGGRIGGLSLFASVSHVTSNGQPLAYVTAARPAAQAAGGALATGGFDDVNRTGAAVRVLGAGGFEHQRQGVYKLKAAYDLTDRVRLTYVGALFADNTTASAETYLTSAGAPAYAGSFNIAGYAYPSVAPSAFANNVYLHDERHWSHSLSVNGTSHRFDWQVIGTLYDFAHDVLRGPTGALPGALTGGPGNITRLEGTGWKTLDAKGAWRADDAGTNVVSAGAHWDEYAVNSNRYTATDWIAGTEGAINLASRGKTRTTAIWAQDEVRIAAPLTLTIGARYEWWRAFDGFNVSTSPVVAPTSQPVRTAHGFSPKASLGWSPVPGWTVRASIGKAYRFPTVGELYQVVTTPVVSLPDSTLKPERASSEELAIEHHDRGGSVRLSLFNEVVNDALISQVGPLAVVPPQTGTFVQNVDRTRARGVELAFQRTDVVPRIDLSGSVTYADAVTSKDSVFPAAVGKLLPSVPHWKATGVVTWRPVSAVSLTAAARYASRNYGALDNSDVVGNTYQGFYRYFVVDLRAFVQVTKHWSMAIGVDNVGNDRYFLFHPFPQRSYSAELGFRF
jgi:iron complex outermembrane receptor protein